MSAKISNECVRAQAEYREMMKEVAEIDEVEYETFVRMIVRKVRAVVKKSATTFVAACYRAYITNELTESSFKEIATLFGAATHRYKAYVKYFKDNRYVVA